MSHLEWDDSYNTGFVEVDDEHRALFRLVNLMDSAAENCDGPEVFRESFKALRRYTLIHFRKEEECLQEHGMLVADMMREQHLVLQKELHDLWVDSAITTPPRTVVALKD
ncbi:MAG: hemerythrin domain-containing protein [Hyphomicrobiales bacterium]|nr:hemerythrin domain-containing protein [Hyphomicrobiales bacterium]